MWREGNGEEGDSRGIGEGRCRGREKRRREEGWEKWRRRRRRLNERRNKR